MDEITSNLKFSLRSGLGFCIGAIIGEITQDFINYQFFLIDIGAFMCLFGGIFMSFEIKDRSEKIKLVILSTIAGILTGIIDTSLTTGRIAFDNFYLLILLAGGVAGLIISLVLKNIRFSFYLTMVGSLATYASIFATLYIINLFAALLVTNHLSPFFSSFVLIIPSFAFFWGAIVSSFLYHFLKNPKPGK